MKSSHQVVLSMLRSQHGSHLFQVGAVALLLGTAGEGYRDDALGDVDQVHLIVLLHSLDQAQAPVEQSRGDHTSHVTWVLCTHTHLEPRQYGPQSHTSALHNSVKSLQAILG